jgi:hypothetical protein
MRYSNTLGVKAHAHLQPNESAENNILFEKKSVYLLHLGPNPVKK